MERLPERRWHTEAVAEVPRLVGTDASSGLSLDEVALRRARFGPNVVSPGRRRGPVVRFLRQFNQPLVYILVVAAVITALLKEWIDATVIFGVVFVNAVIGFVQESRALAAIDALAQRLVAEATVVRGGRQARVPARELVPGDLVLLAAGDKVPADLRLLSEKDLDIDESALTGESLPVHKRANLALEPGAPLADRVNMAYASTVVTHGQGRGVIVATGDDTEVGRISRLIETAEEIATPLTRKIAQFSHFLLTVILALAALTFVVGIARGEGAFDMFMAAVALMVGAIPEGLPAAITIMLALGVGRMARRRAIIRKLPAVETLGSTTVVCSDKTGTLTENQMTVTRVVAGGADVVVTGAGNAPSGELLIEGEPARLEALPGVLECLQAGLLCNDAQLVADDGRWRTEGDPTEGALIAAALKAGLDRERLERSTPRVDTLPFESERQYMATLHAAEEGDATVVYLKGAVEAVLPRCARALTARGDAAPLEAGEVHRAAEEMASRGLRVLALSRGSRPPGTRELAHRDVEEGLTFLGLMGMIDPPRREARDAIDKCRHAGIAVKMITGDHALTARSIAAQLGLRGLRPDSELVAVTGRELEGLQEQELEVVAEESSVFARVTPEQKLRLVRALQARTHVVAMTGDGVNDAPALRQADIGVAMGVTGTDVAKEAADMVLTDDNFASIEAAVEEGRGVFDNLSKLIVWTIPTNLGEGLIIVASVLLGTTLPVLPLQVLWINMTSAVLLGLTLAFEPREPDVMERPPRPVNRPILSTELIVRTLFVGGFILVAGFGLFEIELWRGREIEAARTAAVNVVIMVQTFYLFKCRSLDKPLSEVGWFTNPWVFVGAGAMFAVQLLFTYVPVMNEVFGSAPVHPLTWLYSALVGAMVFVVIAIEKRLALHRRVEGARRRLTSGPTG